jgi:hypothetical protein
MIATRATGLADTHWCSTDPVCMDAGEKGQGPDSCNLAACDACGLLPETSCEEFNGFPDAGLVIGTLDDPNLGYFSDALSDGSASDGPLRPGLRAHGFRRRIVVAFARTTHSPRSPERAVKEG